MSEPRSESAVVGVLKRHPWIGWAAWTVAVAGLLLGMHPRRFASAFQFYLEFAAKLWAEQPIYDPASLSEVSYWPTSLLLMVPLTAFDPTVAASIAFAIFAALLAYASVALCAALFNRHPDALWLAGMLLAVNILPGWYHFKQVQLHIPMTAAMMLAAAAMTRQRWNAAALWLSLALFCKPLALVMVLLAGALVPRMRLLLIAGVAAGLALPFALLPFDYLVAQYNLLGLKLWAVATAPPGEWIYQADFTTLLRAAGIVLPGAASFAIRVAVALGTLWLGWKVHRAGDARGTALALLFLSGLYVTLFGPRNEHISYLAVTPAIAALAFLILLRRADDWRGWLLIGACQVLGFVVSVKVDTVLKPAVVLAIYAWAAMLMARPERWQALVDRGAPVPAAAEDSRLTSP